MNELSPIPAPAQPERARKPDWIRVKAPTSKGYNETRQLMREKKLATVCEEAACPNIGECWTKKHATVMILGDVCTRACAFCNVKTGMPRKVDPNEPQNLADACAEMGLEHIVITSVDRDDLPDGGASQFVKVIEALRRTTPNTRQRPRKRCSFARRTCTPPGCKPAPGESCAFGSPCKPKWLRRRRGTRRCRWQRSRRR